MLQIRHESLASRCELNRRLIGKLALILLWQPMRLYSSVRPSVRPTREVGVGATWNVNGLDVGEGVGVELGAVVAVAVGVRVNLRPRPRLDSTRLDSP
jgi:hypothetical protein